MAPLIVSANPRYFAPSGGAPIVLAGSHTWSNLQDVTYTGATSPATLNYATYLSRLQSWEHNCFRLYTWESPRIENRFSDGQNQFQTPMPYNRSSTPGANDGGNKFDLTSFNSTYFTRLASRVSDAQVAGIYVIVMLYNGWSVEDKEGMVSWDYHPFNPQNNINSVDGVDSFTCHTLNANAAALTAQTAYVDYVIDTVNAYDNVLYEITNEDSPGTDNTAWQNATINHIHSYEAGKAKQHPVGFTVQYPDGDNSVLLASNAEWISPVYSDGTVPTVGASKVYLFDTDHAYGWVAMQSDGVAAQRAWAWKAICRGNNLLFMDPYLDPSCGSGRNTPSGSNVDAYWNTMRYAQGDARTYAQRLTLTQATPQASLSSTGYCLAWAGNEYLVYQSGTGAFTVNLPAKSYNYEWYDPETRGVKGTGTIAAPGGNYTFNSTTQSSPTFSGDAVLLLTGNTAPVGTPVLSVR